MCLECTKLSETFKCSCHDNKYTCPQHWTYENQVEWKKCINYYNVIRSPIDIKEPVLKTANHLHIKYKHKVPGIMKQNEHYPIFEVSDKKSYVKLHGDKYILKQFHFHNASENTIKGIFTQVECHFVHEYIDKHSVSHIVVIGLMLTIEKHHGLKFIDGLFDHSEDTPLKLNLKPLNKLIYNQYHSFIGSLTSPPFTPFLKWFLFDPFYENNDIKLIMNEKDYTKLINLYNNNRCNDISVYNENRYTQCLKNNYIAVSTYTPCLIDESECSSSSSDSDKHH